MHNEEKAGRARTDCRPLGVQAKPSTPTLARSARARIGIHLRAFYDSVVEQPIPDRFSELIARLDDAPANSEAIETDLPSGDVLSARESSTV